MTIAKSPLEHDTIAAATDSFTFLGIAFLLLLVTFVACLVPARRAMNIDPITALKYD